jgi:hypothetical protein
VCTAQEPTVPAHKTHRVTFTNRVHDHAKGHDAVNHDDARRMDVLVPAQCGTPSGDDVHSILRPSGQRICTTTMTCLLASLEEQKLEGTLPRVHHMLTKHVKGAAKQT